MIAGLYTAASGMDSILLQQDAIAANVANAGVSGHKGEAVVFRSFPEMEFTGQGEFLPPNSAAQGTIGRMGTGVGVDWSYMNFLPGPTHETGVPTDLMLEGDGFFVVGQGNDEVRYTRNSHFKIQIDAEGREGVLTTAEGLPLLGNQGPVTVPVDEDFTIDISGNVVVDDRTINTLNLVAFEDNNVLMPESGALFRLEDKWRDTVRPAEAQVHQGYAEKSNVNTIVEMVRLIDSYRNYESSSKVLQVLDRTLDQAVNRLGQAGR